jgi:subfamily B ATP-binding cassette protein MsbA
MIAFLLKVWGLARPYRTRLFLGVLMGVLGGLTAPLTIATIMFVYGAVFPSGDVSNTYVLTNNVIAWPPLTLAKGGSTRFDLSLSASSNSVPTLHAQIPNTENPRADVSVFLSSPFNLQAGRSPVYTIVVTNRGAWAVSNVVLTAEFPTNLVSSALGSRQLPIRGLPTFVQNWFFDVRDAIAGGLHRHPAAVPGLIVFFLLVVFLRGLFGYLNVYFLQWTSSRTIADLRTRLFAHLLNLSAGFYNENSTGQLMSRVMNDTGALQNILSGATSVVVRDPIVLASTLVFLFSQQPKLTLIALVILPVCIIPIVVFGRKVRRPSREAQAQSAELTQTMTEAFTGYRIVKAYNLESTVAGEFHAIARKYVSNYMRIIRASEMPGPLIEFFGACGVALLLVYLIYLSAARPSATDFLQLVGSIFYMYQPIKNLTRLQNQVIQARAASERAFALLATQNSVPEPAQPRPLKAAGADIHFDRVNFAYGEKMVLRDIELHIQPGQLVALVGSSGAGKTTLANLLLRFYDPTGGAIRIGGEDIRGVATRDLRNQIAVVTQETILFNDSIRRNIELGRPGATSEEIIAAARNAYAYDFIMDKDNPQGFDAVIGEKGVKLSGGQRQRIAIARAVLRNAPILVLDEATSALDTESERAVQAALDELMRNRTTLCIAHRLSTIFHADLIVVMDQGRIVETGRHEELIQRGGIYQKLYELQFQS